MLRFLTIVIIFIVSNSAQAQIFSELHLKLYDDTPFTLTIDQKKYTMPSNNFVLRLFPGKHYLSVTRTMLPTRVGKDTFNIATFTGIITIPYNVRMYAHVDPSNMFSVFKVVPYDSPVNPDANNHFDRSTQYPHQPISTIPGWDKGTFNLQTEESYKRLKDILEKTNSSKSKLNILKQAVTYNPVKSHQVAELMKYMDFDSERLEFAKYAYYFTTDKENYFLINDSFIFSGSIREINEHIYKFSY